MLTARLLQTLADCRPAEVDRVRLLWLHAFLLGLAIVCFRTASESLFLDALGVCYLPHAYLGATGLSLLIVFGFARAQARLPLGRLLPGMLALAAAAALGCRLGLLAADQQPAIVVARVLSNTAYLLIELEFWTLAVRLLDLRQGKRLFGLVASGEGLAEFIGGFAAAGLVQLVPVADLMLVSTAALVICLGLVRHTAARYLTTHALAVGGTTAGGTTAGGTTASKQAASLSAGQIRQNPLMRLTLVVFGLTTMAWFLIDFAFNDRLAKRYPDPGELATFLGMFFGATALLTLLTQSLLSSRLIERLGVKRALLGLPLVVGGGAMLALMSGLGGAMTLLFAVLCAVKMTERVLTRGLQNPSMRVLYQALPDAQRVSFMAWVEGTGAFLGGLTALSLLLLVNCTTLHAVQVVQALVVLAGIWVMAALRLGQTYRKYIQQSLSRRQLRAEALSLGDPAVRAAYQQWLTTAEPVAIANSLRMLDLTQGHPEITRLLIELAQHAHPQVRLAALGQIERAGLLEAGPVVRGRLTDETDPAVRGQALRAALALGLLHDLDQASEQLDSDSAQLRQDTAVALLQYGGIDGVLLAGVRVLAWSQSSDPAERLLAAEVLGQVGSMLFFRPLLPLLEDADLSVRQAAIVAAGRVKHPAVWPAVLAALHHPRLRQSAVNAILAGGGAAIRPLRTSFAQTNNLSHQLLLVRLANRIRDPRALRLLCDWSDDPNPFIAQHALEGTARALIVPDARERQRHLKQAEMLLYRAVALLVRADGLHERPSDAPLQRAVRQEASRYADLVLLHLLRAMPSAVLWDARTQLLTSVGPRRALALEAIDNTLPQPFATALTVLLDDAATTASRAKLKPWMPDEHPPSRYEVFRQLADEAAQLSLWTRACLLYALGHQPIADLADHVRAACDDPNPIIQQTARWASLRQSRGPSHDSDSRTYLNAQTTRAVRSRG
jgi:AAA family ATP:ADP antiporter